MILKIRTRDHLETLLEQSYTAAWVIADNKIDQITEVWIYQFDGKRLLKSIFDKTNSYRNNQKRLVVAFKNASIENIDYKWQGQNPIKYSLPVSNLKPTSSAHQEPNNWLIENPIINELSDFQTPIIDKHDLLGETLKRINSNLNIQSFPGYILITTPEEIFDELSSKSYSLFLDPSKFNDDLKIIQSEHSDDNRLKMLKALDLTINTLHSQGGQVYTLLTPNWGSDNVFICMPDEKYHDEIILLAHFNETLNSAEGWYEQFMEDFPDSFDKYLETKSHATESIMHGTSDLHFEIIEDPFFGKTINSNFRLLGWSESYYSVAIAGMSAAKKYC
jgi:hypothetical protein